MYWVLKSLGVVGVVMEYEAKFRVRDHSEVERALRTLGAVYEEEVFEVDHCIDLYPCDKLRERDEALWIRISEGSWS